MDEHKKAGCLIVIVAPSGTGKSTLIKLIKQDQFPFVESVSYTTRPMREGEVNGREYHFVTKQEFEEMIKEDKFIEYALVHEKYYGTARENVDRLLNQGKNLLFDLDVQGADALKKIYGSTAQIIFIRPPSWETLSERLKNRGTDDPKVIEIRLKNAKSELKRMNDFDFLILNDDLNKAHDRLKSVIKRILT